MLIYQSVAFILKAFSSTRGTRRMYRWLANCIGQTQQKSKLNLSHIKRGKLLLDCLEEIGLILTPNSHILELGTGWIHFYSVFLRLFSTPRITVFDVTDNRQFSALQWIFYRLPEYLTTYSTLNKKQVNTIQELTRKIAATSTFEELYKLLGFTYIINSGGDLSSFENESFDLVFSFDVLEHIRSDNLHDSIASYCRILKSGGYSIHQIGLDDHLTHYDRKASRKQFLSYSEFDWKLRFENQVQYFNRVPCSEFLTLFENCGFKRVKFSVIKEPESVRDLSIAKQYQDLSLENLEATRAIIVHQKLDTN